MLLLFHNFLIAYKFEQRILDMLRIIRFIRFSEVITQGELQLIMRHAIVLLLVLSSIISFLPLSVATVHAQDELVATLEVFNAGVEIKRAGTDLWLPVNIESLVGQGDAIRTDETGEALITFFADGTSSEIESDTEIIISEFVGDDDSFDLTLEVLRGITRQQFESLLDQDSKSSYQVVTPGITMTVRGTDFAVRVEDDGRSALITTEGLVDADTTPVEDGFGVRAEENGPLSDVVPATNFDELDAALDGCSASNALAGDILFVVRRAPNTDSETITTLTPDQIGEVFGVSEDEEWYRIPIDNPPFEYGWVSASLVELGDNCTMLREFTNTHAE